MCCHPVPRLCIITQLVRSSTQVHSPLVLDVLGQEEPSGKPTSYQVLPADSEPVQDSALALER